MATAGWTNFMVALIHTAWNGQIYTSAVVWSNVHWWSGQIYTGVVVKFTLCKEVELTAYTAAP